MGRPPGAEVEWLTTTSQNGSAMIDLTGNGYAQIIVGNAAANIIWDGRGGGADTLYGRAGDDTYAISNAGTRAVELANQGNDRIATAVSYQLGADDDIERLTTKWTSGQTAINLTGNQLSQSITGNAGVNRLDGMAGADTLSGMGGADSFVFSTSLGAGNIDRITDFQAGSDHILLNDVVFAGLAPGALAAAAFRASLSGLAADPSDRIIYETDTGRLFFDRDGPGAAGYVQFAQLQPGLTLSYGDFSVV